LRDTPGQITAGKSLGLDVVAYKDRSMYLGRYIGAPLVWDWQLISSEIGTPCQESVVNIGTEHIFAGYDGFYRYDGSRPTPIGNPLKEWYNINVSKSNRSRMLSVHDRDQSNIYFFYADSTDIVKQALVYNYKNDNWGKASLYEDMSLEASMEYEPGSIYIYDTFGDFWPTYDVLPDITYDSTFWNSASPLPAIFQNDHILYSMTSPPDGLEGHESSIVCNFIGDDNIYTFLDRIRVQFNSQDLSSASLEIGVCDFVGGTLSTTTDFFLQNNKFDILLTSKWFTPTFTFNGDYEITGFSINLTVEGSD
jgi:hypothetical protein